MIEIVDKPSVLSCNDFNNIKMCSAKLKACKRRRSLVRVQPVYSVRVGGSEAGYRAGLKMSDGHTSCFQRHKQQLLKSSGIRF